MSALAWGGGSGFHPALLGASERLVSTRQVPMALLNEVATGLAPYLAWEHGNAFARILGICSAVGSSRNCGCSRPYWATTA